LVVAKIMTDLRIRELGIIATDRRGFQGKNPPLEVIVPGGFAVELATHIHPVLGPRGDLIELKLDKGPDGLKGRGSRAESTIVAH
jgi:hypothetical protein